MPINILQPPQQDGATMVNQAVQQAAQQQAAQGLMGNNPATYGNLASYREARPYIDAMTKAKQQYELGKAMVDGQGQITPEGQLMMNTAHDTANQARTMLAAMGADYGDYDKVPFAQAAQNLAMRDNQFLNNVMGMNKSSGDVFQEEYIKNIRTGMSERRAMEEADLVARNYSNQRAGLLNDAFQMYGQADNAINPLGLQLLNRLAQEDQEAANAYYKTFGNPRDEYTMGNQLALAEDQYQKQMERGKIQQGYDLDKMAAQFGYQRQMAAINAEQARLMQQGKFEQAIALEAYKAQIKAALGGDSETKGNGSNPSGYDKARAEAINTQLKNMLGAYGADFSAWPEGEVERYQMLSDELTRMNVPQTGQQGQDFNPNDYNQAAQYMQKAYDDFANGGSDRYTLAEIIQICKLKGIPSAWVDDYFANVINYGQEANPTSTSNATSSTNSNNLSNAPRATLNDAQQARVDAAEVARQAAAKRDAEEREKIALAQESARQVKQWRG